MSDSVVNGHRSAVVADRPSSDAAAWKTTAALDVVVVGAVSLAWASSTSRGRRSGWTSRSPRGRWATRT